MPHTSPTNDLPIRPWHTEIFFPLRPVNVVNVNTNVGDRPGECQTQNIKGGAALQMLYRTDSTCQKCSATLIECLCTEVCELESDTTFNPTEVFKKNLSNSGRSVVDRMYKFGKGGSSFSGFPVENDNGCLTALLHVACCCTPLVTAPRRTDATSETETFLTLLQDLTTAEDRNSQLDIAKKLATKYSLPSGQIPCPVDMLKRLFEDAGQQYVERCMGVDVVEKGESGAGTTKTVTMISIKGHESNPRHLDTMMRDKPDAMFSGKGDFFWVQVGSDSSTVYIPPRIFQDTHLYYLLGYISLEKRDGKSLWVATIRNENHQFLVMDHTTCQPKLYDILHTGVVNPTLSLYAKKAPEPPTWLRPCPESIKVCKQFNGLDKSSLIKDGLVTGSVSDLLTEMNIPNLQQELQKAVEVLLDSLLQKRQENSQNPSATRLTSVKGWPMPLQNDLSLVYGDNFQGQGRGGAGSTRSTSEFGHVLLQRSVTSPKVDGFNLLVCSIFVSCVCVPGDVYVLSDCYC